MNMEVEVLSSEDLPPITFRGEKISICGESWGNITAGPLAVPELGDVQVTSR